MATQLEILKIEGYCKNLGVNSKKSGKKRRRLITNQQRKKKEEEKKKKRKWIKTNDENPSRKWKKEPIRVIDGDVFSRLLRTVAATIGKWERREMGVAIRKRVPHKRVAADEVIIIETHPNEFAIIGTPSVAYQSQQQQQGGRIGENAPPRLSAVAGLLLTNPTDRWLLCGLSHFMLYNFFWRCFFVRPPSVGLTPPCYRYFPHCLRCV